MESPFCSVVLRDFNGKCNKWWIGDSNDHCGLELDTLCSLAGFSVLIKEPTNLEPNKRPSCIDLIFSSQQNLVSDSGVHPSLYQTCHHQIIYAMIDLKFIFRLFMIEKFGLITEQKWNTLIALAP